MSAVIKSENGVGLSTVRPISSVVALSVRDPEKDSLKQRVASLEEELCQRDRVAAALRLEIDQAFRDGSEKGYASGFASAEDRQADRLKLLEKTMQQSQAELRDRMGALERLAPVLAQDCVELVLGDSDSHVEHLRSIISTQLSRIERALVIAMELSHEDFPDGEALAAFAARIDARSFTVSTSADLPSGGCIIALRLGRMDVSVRHQWGVLRAALEEMALPEDNR